MTYKIFCYGTLRHGHGNYECCLAGNSTHLGSGHTDAKFSLYVDGLPFVAKTPASSQIVGDVFEIDSATLKRIDRLEGHPRWYCREEVEVTLTDGSKVTAWLYFNRQPHPQSKPVESGDYATTSAGKASRGSGRDMRRYAKVA